ncbi:hypothetical protein MSPP1_002727 [Malassezia sp. CBS 17886]|nr:hypothetical protein MSPP1_002727 [Malassezia sp. CBS 17886]
MSQPQGKLSVYPEPDQPIVAVETTSELERQVAQVRRAVQGYTHGATQMMRSGVDNVVHTEQKVENRMGRLLAKDEQVTPNGLYVGVATLASMVFTRHRTFPIRWLTPPLVFAVSLRYFLPHTTTNIAGYYKSVEHSYCPQFSEKRSHLWDTLVAHTSTGVGEASKAARASADSMRSGLQSMEKNTGVKLASLLPQGAKPAAPAPVSAEDSKKLI